jgi:hypothetical protein
LYIGFTIVPIIAVESRPLFAAKIIAVVAIANALGATIYFAGRKRAGDAQGDVGPPAGSGLV